MKLSIDPKKALFDCCSLDGMEGYVCWPMAHIGMQIHLEHVPG